MLKKKNQMLNNLSKCLNGYVYEILINKKDILRIYVNNSSEALRYYKTYCIINGITFDLNNIKIKNLGKNLNKLYETEIKNENI